MKTIFTILVLIGSLAGSSSFATARLEEDTTKMKKKDLPLHWKFTARLHSKGMFMYSGRLGTDNSTFDVNFTFEYHKWGLLLFKGLDLQDHNTDYNFSLLSIFRNIKISDKITVTPYLGTFLEQSNQFADRGSDAVCIVITNIKVRPHLTFEHTALFGNLIFEPQEKDWVNRFRLTYTGKHLDVVASVWHNNQIFDRTSYLNEGLNVAYSRMKVTKHFFMSVGLTGLSTAYTSNEEENPSTNRLMFTVAAQWVGR